MYEYAGSSRDLILGPPLRIERLKSVRRLDRYPPSGLCRTACPHRQGRPCLCTYPLLRSLLRCDQGVPWLYILSRAYSQETSEGNARMQAHALIRHSYQWRGMLDGWGIGGVMRILACVVCGGDVRPVRPDMHREAHGPRALRHVVIRSVDGECIGCRAWTQQTRGPVHVRQNCHMRGVD